MRPDLCQVENDRDPLEYLGRFYVDSLVHDQHALKELLRIYGENRVILGSDYPFPLGEHHPGALIESADISDIVRAQLLGGNALEWLNKKAEDYLR